MTDRFRSFQVMPDRFRSFPRHAGSLFGFHTTQPLCANQKAIRNDGEMTGNDPAWPEMTGNDRAYHTEAQ